MYNGSVNSINAFRWMMELMAGARAATWNVRGALSGSSGKLEAILHWGSQEKVGIIALQEVFATGLSVTGVSDDDGCDWQLCLAGPQAGRKHASTGFLVSESFQLHDFQAGTPRVSTVVVSPRGSQEQVVFVSAYAPTEEKATLEEVLQFYEVLEQAYVTAVAEYGKSKVIIMGDFNVDLAKSIVIEPVPYRVTGSCMKVGLSSPNAQMLLDFCQGKQLVIPQTFGRKSEGVNSKNWETWRHPGTGKSHVKDLILVPRENSRMIKKCRPVPGADALGSDHKPVLCTWLPPSHGRFCKQPALPVARKRKARTSTVDLRSLVLESPRKKLKYKACFAKLVAGKPPGWAGTEAAVAVAAVKSFPVGQSEPDTWKTDRALFELRPLLVESAMCSRALVTPQGGVVSALLLGRKKRVKKAIAVCIAKHRRVHRNKLLKWAAGTSKGSWQAMRDLTGQKRDKSKQPVSGEKFAEHFESVYAKVSNYHKLRWLLQ